MTSRWKKVWADFWGSKGRTILTILTIAVGVLAVGFNNNMRLFMVESMDGDFLSSNPSEAMVYAYPMDENSVKIARQVAGVDAVEGKSIIAANIVMEGRDEIRIQFTAIENPNTLTVNTLKPALGETGIAVPGEKEVLIDSSAASLGFKVGDTITVELDNGKIRKLRLAGYLHSATGYPYNLTRQVTAYVTLDTIVWLGGDRSFNALAVSVSEKQTDTDHVTEVAQAVADRIERSGATVDFVYINQPGHHYAYTTAQAMFLILGVLGWLTVLLSGVLIVNTITALMSQQTRQIGIMKAVGGRGTQIFGMYVVLIFFFGLGALAISVPLANNAAKTIGDGMAAWLNFFPAEYHGYRSTLVQQLIVALAVPLLAAWIPMYDSVRVTVREALTDYGIKGAVKRKEKKVSRAALLIPRPMRLSLRNAFRRKARLALTLFTLVLAGAIFISIYNLWASFDQVIHDIQGYFLADINIGFNRGYRLERVSSAALSVPGVSGVEGWLEYPGTIVSENKDEAGRQIMFVAPPSNSTLIDPIISAGRWLTTGDENAIVVGNQIQSIFPGLKIGGTMKIKINGRETEWHIVGFYTIVGNPDVPLAYVNYEYISRIIGQPGIVYALRVITTEHDSATQNRVNDQLQALLESRGIHVTDARLGADFVRDQTAQTDIFVYFMLVMAAMIAIVGGLGLMGTMSINVLERTREIGILRATGASNFDIQSIVIVEGLVVGLISWMISIVVSIPITNILAYGVGISMLQAPMPVVYGTTGIVAWLLFTIVLATVASSLPAQRASRLTVKDTLAYE
ncbi:MAG: ABC transporter permease [Anaerolineales bacterium]|nr:ABC transporter permease [Anaerolineales bacterium]